MIGFFVTPELVLHPIHEPFEALGASKTEGDLVGPSTFREGFGHLAEVLFSEGTEVFLVGECVCHNGLTVFLLVKTDDLETCIDRVDLGFRLLRGVA